MTNLGPIYRSTDQLDHDMATHLEGWLVDFATMGVDRYATLASLTRVLDDLDRNTNGRTILHEAAVDARRDGTDEFVKAPVRVVHTSGAGTGVEVGPYSLSLMEALDLACAVRSAVSRAANVEEVDG